MGLTVWKFHWPMNAPDVADISMPIGAEVIHVGEQDNRLCIWARVEDSAPKAMYRFAICGTGTACPPDKYLGTAKLYGGQLILHVFQQDFNS